MHPMVFSNLICKNFDDSDIVKFKRIGKNIEVVSFKSFSAANRFVDQSKNLPNGWISYISNFKILRNAVIRGIEQSFSHQEILEGISWPGDPVKVVNVERLKFRARGSDELKESSSVKLTFESDLLPEFLYV